MGAQDRQDRQDADGHAAVAEDRAWRFAVERHQDGGTTYGKQRVDRLFPKRRHGTVEHAAVHGMAHEDGDRQQHEQAGQRLQQVAHAQIRPAPELKGAEHKQQRRNAVAGEKCVEDRGSAKIERADDGRLPGDAGKDDDGGTHHHPGQCRPNAHPCCRNIGGANKRDHDRRRKTVRQRMQRNDDETERTGDQECLRQIEPLTLILLARKPLGEAEKGKAGCQRKQAMRQIECQVAGHQQRHAGERDRHDGRNRGPDRCQRRPAVSMPLNGESAERHEDAGERHRGQHRGVAGNREGHDMTGDGRVDIGQQAAQRRHAPDTNDGNHGRQDGGIDGITARCAKGCKSGHDKAEFDHGIAGGGGKRADHRQRRQQRGNSGGDRDGGKRRRHDALERDTRFHRQLTGLCGPVFCAVSETAGPDEGDTGDHHQHDQGHRPGFKRCRRGDIGERPEAQADIGHRRHDGPAADAGGEQSGGPRRRRETRTGSRGSGFRTRPAPG